MQHDFQAIVDGGRTVAADSAAAMYAAARLYYDEGLTQHEVAKRLSVSRSTVSRLLQLARDNDIVRIEVRAPSPAAGLSADLAAELGLQRACRRARPGPPGRASGARRSGARRARPDRARRRRRARRLLGQDRLGDRPGAALPQPPRRPPRPGRRGDGEDDVRFQPNEIARRVAAASGGEVSFLHAPALPSPDSGARCCPIPDRRAAGALEPDRHGARRDRDAARGARRRACARPRRPRGARGRGRRRSLAPLRHGRRARGAAPRGHAPRRDPRSAAQRGHGHRRRAGPEKAASIIGAAPRGSWTCSSPTR